MTCTEGLIQGYQPNANSPWAIQILDANSSYMGPLPSCVYLSFSTNSYCTLKTTTKDLSLDNAAVPGYVSIFCRSQPLYSSRLRQKLDPPLSASSVSAALGNH
ncbi:hypothetical protein PCASD_26232 [Puccinia coronata f. sp. avenae]|uniref:Uncharacterized protein n=1 Tax=Puccinia coronata f. sp. avenae TaxID=200324 RepID=A0A2N5RWW2_9BASI|nr:hypothetical protein PCASD_26232 [Puccinia coronata f. sp. avenae]